MIVGVKLLDSPVRSTDNYGMGTKTVRLIRSLTGYQPYHMNQLSEIPQGAEISVINSDLNESDSMVAWNGRTFIVDKSGLAALGKPA